MRIPFRCSHWNLAALKIISGALLTLVPVFVVMSPSIRMDIPSMIVLTPLIGLSFVLTGTISFCLILDGMLTLDWVRHSKRDEEAEQSQ